MTRKKAAYLRKKNKLKNKRLVKKYPWLRPISHWYTGKVLRHYDYEWTWYDDMPIGWRIAFGNMMLAEIDAEVRKAGLLRSYTVEQVKEKYGQLCWYDYGGNEEIDNIISKYETISEHVCLSCGKPDVKITNAGWIIPLCKECFDRGVNTTRAYEEVVSSNDSGYIPDAYTARCFRPDSKTEYDISDTVKTVRMKYERRIARSNRRL